MHILDALLGRDERIVSASVLYGATRTLIEQDAARRGASAEFVDITDLEEVRTAMEPGARALFCESISNPLMEVADIPALASIAHAAGALLVVDNTFATPMLMRPLELGADVVIHSCTKYINGHDDIMAGTVSVGGATSGGTGWPRSGIPGRFSVPSSPRSRRGWPKRNQDARGEDGRSIVETHLR